MKIGIEIIRFLIWCINIILILKLVFCGKKETQSTWAWILLLLNFPFIGFILYLLTGQGIRKENQKEASENTECVTEDNQVRIITNGEEKFQSMLEDLRSAKKEILMQYYIFKNDFLFEEIVRVLCEKAADGVSIKLLYDTLGSRKIKKSLWERLRKKGIEVKGYRISMLRNFLSALSGFNYRNHRKIVVVDQYIGYIGGYNVGKEYLGMDSKFGPWRDTHFRIVGSGVHSLRNVFLRDWGKPENISVYAGGTKGSMVQMVTSGPASETPHIRNVYLRCIGNASKIIRIQTPYFIPDTAVLNALKLALLSGKKVELMIPCKPDHMFVYWATRYYAAQLLTLGAKIYIYQKGFLHAKGILMDEDVYCFGTANMDIRSFYLNYEVNAIVYGETEVKKMSRIFEQDLQDCQELTWQEYASRNLVIRVKEQISRLLSPLL